MQIFRNRMTHLLSILSAAACAVVLCQANVYALEVGEKAPDFSLLDTQGHKHTLSEAKGKYVVLEWFNPDCPFVKKHYGSGNMQELQNVYTKQQGVVWFSIDSSAPGKQGNYPAEELEKIMQEKGSSATAILLDANGKVGRTYGAKTTPHMFVINPEGILIYAGAIDDKPSVEPADVAGAHNYVQYALHEAMGGKPLTSPKTDSYGCSVKYAD